MNQKQVVSTLVSIFKKSATWTYNKNKLYKTSNCRFSNMLDLNYFKKGLGLVSPPPIVNDLSRKIFSCYILLTD